ncbi:MAG: hypothetical protein CME06_11210 [Gemmatimonadetes bacterium]|nr:hypothetical protein [Gemmatimonadota bacterium]
MTEELALDPSTDVDWGLIGKTLVAHAIRRARRYPRLRGNFWPKGQGPEDIVSELMVRYWSGARKWDRKRYPDPLIFFMMHLNGMIDALAKSASARYERPTRQSEDGSELTDRVDLRGQEISGRSIADPESELLREEQEAAAHRRIECLKEAVAGQPELGEVLDALLDGCEPKPRHLASRLDQPVREINNRLRRLRRIDITVA